MHIHIEKDDAYAKYWLKPVRLARSKGFKAKDLSMIRGIIEKHEKILIKRWDEFFTE